MITKKIPKTEMPKKSDKFQFNDEPLISLFDYFNDAIIIEPKYYLSSIDGAISECFLRKTAVIKLESALKRLDTQFTFKIYDAWRPLYVQQFLYDSFYYKISSEHLEWSQEMVKKETLKFVSAPSYDLNYPSVHNSGGAVDLTLVYKKTGKELEMGTDFDDFSIKAHTSYYEDHGNDETIKNNRRLLYWTMINAGFTNYPTEWWHYDFGDSFWGYYTGKSIMYKGIL